MRAGEDGGGGRTDGAEADCEVGLELLFGGFGGVDLDGLCDHVPVGAGEGGV